MNANELDQKAAEAFAEHITHIINGGAISLMLSIGHRTGLFDKLAELPPSTSEEIAEAAHLNERYVREWLGTMVTGRIIEYDASTDKYYLPREHAAFLTRAAAPNNMAVTAQFMPLLASVEDQIVECFFNGGGVPYSAYPRFHQVMAEESNQTTGLAIVDTILPGVPGLVEALYEGIEVLDVGCGSGHTINVMAKAFPKSRFAGYDFSEEAIETARAEAASLGLSNVRFEIQDAAKLDEPNRYGLITTFDAIHDQAQPAKMLEGIFKSLRSDGVYLAQDIRASSYVHKNIEHPLGPFIYTVSCLHCMTVSLALNGDGLGAAWGEEKALAMLAEAGFKNVEVRQFPHDILNNYYIAKK
ncbi:MAG TPA: class I SAM-dependent methyltransferase [Blastocatellia bacterium]|nr:class I SAM-dependent methyltransferase [Blastocatellia bacterium]